MNTNTPKYLIYDGRYVSDPDSALVMDTADSLKEAKRAATDQGGAVVVDSLTGEIVNWNTLISNKIQTK